MNRNFLSILILFLPLQLVGQMFPLSNQFINNPLAINPAFAGCHDALSTTLLYRSQWIGFKDAPKSTILSVHTPLFYDKIGLGLLVDRNSTGIFRETNLIGNYAYRIGLPAGKLALGIGFGATICNIAWNELDATDPDDALLNNNPASKVLPDFSIGSYYYSEKYFIGFSIPMFLSHEMDNSGRYKIRNRFSEYNYFFTSGYLFDLSPWIDLFPSVLIKYHHGHSPQIDINSQLILKDRIWLGIGYQNKDVIIGMLQCQLNDQLKMSYSHDFDTGTVGRYKRGSNEFVLNYTFKYLRKVASPRHF